MNVAKTWWHIGADGTNRIIGIGDLIPRNGAGSKIPHNNQLIAFAHWEGIVPRLAMMVNQ